jgi:hypothetical protein
MADNDNKDEAKNDREAVKNDEAVIKAVDVRRESDRQDCPWWWLDEHDMFKPSDAWLKLVEEATKLGFSKEDMTMTEIALHGDLGVYPGQGGYGRTPIWELRNQDALRWKKEDFPPAYVGANRTGIYLEVVPRVLVPYLVYRRQEGSEAVDIDVRPWAHDHLHELHKDNVGQWKTRMRAVITLSLVDWKYGEDLGIL